VTFYVFRDAGNNSRKRAVGNMKEKKKKEKIL
jgi:hypothetical protein